MQIDWDGKKCRGNGSFLFIWAGGSTVDHLFGVEEAKGSKTIVIHF